MVTSESEDDTIFSDSTSAESFNIDEIDFSTSFEEGGVIESNVTVPVFVNGQKEDFPINDQSNTQIVPVDHLVPIPEQYPDTSHLYRTNMAFDSKNEARDWCVRMGKNNNCVIVTPSGVCRKRNVWTNGKGCRFKLGCERGGVHKSHKSKKEVEKSIGKKRKKDTGTKKINCPFKLSVLCGDDSKWRVTVRNGRHSHDPPESLVGHVTSSLSQEEYQRVVHLYNDGAKPATILTTMQREFPGIVCHIKTIYNAILKSKRISGDGRTSVQEFKHLCAENHYICRSRTNSNKEITDLFFAHPKFASLANTFHNFVILDNTYKTNLYDMPLLNVVSHTSTKAPFTVALCFMQFEREDNFVWAFERLKEIYLYDNVPTLFLTDCSQAMIKAVKRVFPFSTHLLCTWHINKDMMAYCKPIINPPKKKKNKNKNKDDEQDEQDEIVPELIPQEKIQQNELEKEKRKKQKLEWAEFKDEWTSLCMSRTIEDFNTKYKRFVESWDGRHGIAVSYCVRQWFKPHKEKFVSAWTNKVKHFDNQATSLVESSHGRVKSYAVRSSGSFPTFFEAVHRMFGADITRLLQQFEISKTQSKWRYGKEPIFKLLIGNVSHFSLRSMMLEKQYKSMIGSDENGCVCTIKYTMGLPCSHVMQMYSDMKKPIPLTAVDTFWRQLSLKSVNKVREERMFHELTVLGDIEQKWLQATPHEKEMIESDMNVIARPGATVDLEPSFKKVKTKGETSTKSRWDDNKRLLSKHELVDKDYEVEDQENKSGTIGKLKSGTKVFPRILHSQLTPTSAVGLVRTIGSADEVSSTVIQSHQRTTATDVLSEDGNFVDDKYFRYMPVHMIPFITSTDDVARLGNCGFEVVDKQLNLGSLAKRLNITGPQYVREKMVKNMERNEAVYRSMWGNKEYEALVCRITLPRNTTAISRNNWMLMPDCGFIIADTFSAVVHYIGKDVSYTFAPATVKMSNRTKNKSIVMGFVEGNHFISMKLSGNCPLPPEPDLSYWEEAKNEWSEEWLRQYELRISQWKYLSGLQKIVPNLVSDSVPINVVDD